MLCCIILLRCCVPLLCSLCAVCVSVAVSRPHHFFAEWNKPRNSLKCPNKCTDCCFSLFCIYSLNTVNNSAFVRHFIRGRNSPVKMCILRVFFFFTFIIYYRRNSHAHTYNVVQILNKFRFFCLLMLPKYMVAHTWHQFGSHIFVSISAVNMVFFVCIRKIPGAMWSQTIHSLHRYVWIMWTTLCGKKREEKSFCLQLLDTWNELNTSKF